MSSNNLRKCKFCGNDIASKGKVTCPNCGKVNKKPLYKRVWFIVLIAIIFIGVIGSIGDDEPKAEGDKALTSKLSDKNDAKAEPVKEEPKAEPIEVTIDQLNEALDGNALKAADTYKGEYVKLTGLVSVIDSSGKYFSLESPNADFTLIGFTCDIKEKHRDDVMNFEKGQSITVIGKITTVGEIMGYRMDLDEIENENEVSSETELVKDSSGIIEITVEDLNEALKENALKAANVYKGEKVRLTGKLSNIDSSGKYFSLIGVSEDYSFTSVMCKIKEEHLDRVMDFENKQLVTVLGEISDVGEVLGYTVQVETIE